MFRPIHKNVPYGFEGVLRPGTYVIADNELARTRLPDGIWTNDHATIATLGTDPGYYKVYSDHKIHRYGLHNRISILPLEETLDSTLGFIFTSKTVIRVLANEMYGTFNIKYEDQHIIVEYDDDDGTSYALDLNIVS